MEIKRIKHNILIIILVVFSTAPAFAIDSDSRNILLISLMSISPVLLFLNFRFYKEDLLMILFLLSILFFPIIQNPESHRWSTVIFTVIFCMSFIAYKNILKSSGFELNSYMKVLKFLILAYFIVLVIQQLCVLLGLPIFNVSNYRLNEPWKLNSLSTEPSHSGRIMGLLMYSYISIREIELGGNFKFKRDFNNNKIIWFGFFWSMLTMISGTAILFLYLVLFKAIKDRKFLIYSIVFLIIFSSGLGPKFASLDRFYSTFFATLSFNPDLIIAADQSAAFRIVPFIILIKMVDFYSVDGLFGYGVDHVASFLSFYVPGMPEGWTGGGLLQLWIDFGFISFLLFILFNFLNFMKSINISLFLFWLFLVLMQGINNQILWLCLIILFTNEFFKKKYSKIKNRNLKI